MFQNKWDILNCETEERTRKKIKDHYLWINKTSGFREKIQKFSFCILFPKYYLSVFLKACISFIIKIKTKKETPTRTTVSIKL